MPVRLAVLGLLIERQGYGYELVQRLGERLGESWQLNHSVIYTALDRLEAASLVEGHRRQRAARDAGRVSRRDARVVYRATDAGRATFGEWVTRPSEALVPVRNELCLKLVSAGPGDLAGLLATLDHEEQLLLRTRNGHVEAHERAAALPRLWSDQARALVRSATRHRLDAELAWLQVVRDAIDGALADAPSSRQEQRGSVRTGPPGRRLP